MKRKLLLCTDDIPFSEQIRRALPIALLGSFVRTKYSFVSAFINTYMYIFDKADVSDKSSA